MEATRILCCTHLVLGTGIAAMARALTLPDGDVVVLGEDTCLYAEMARTADWRIPRGLAQGWMDRLFPAEIRENGEMLHPDKCKRHGEALLQSAGVRLLYACQVIGCENGRALFAHKAGLFAIAYTHLYDCREKPALAHPAYCLHTMDRGEHKVLVLPSSHPENNARALFDRYEEALGSLPPGRTLARGGTEATERDGLSLSQAVARGESLLPRDLPYPAGTHAPRADNPLYQPAERFSDLNPIVEDCDAVVVGGGTAGAPAALYCARQGLRTVLLEMNQRLGGTGTVGGVSIYWFGLRTGATQEIDRAVDAYYQQWSLPREKCMWTTDDVFLPDLKAHALLKLCLEAQADVRLGCVACGVEMRGNRVLGVYWVQNGQVHLTRASIVLDCTGDGDLAMMAGARHVYGNARDGMTYWASLAQHTAPDRYRNNFSTMVHVGDPLDYTRFILAGRLRGENMNDHGEYVAVRESRHIAGLETVALEDIVAMKPVADPLYECFSNYDPKGRLTADMAYFGLLPPNQRTVIPRGAVIPVDAQGRPYSGLLVGGKAISCTHDAFPGVRMQPDLQRQGLALAALAGCAIRQQTETWQAQNVAQAILQLGGDMPQPRPVPEKPLRDAVASLTGEEPWEWLDAPADDDAQFVTDVIRIMTAQREAALPHLKAAFDRADTDALRLTLARLLLWHRDETGAQTVMDAANRMLDAEPGLPKRRASIRYGQMLPDHGLMPEIVYLLNSLAHAPGTPVLPLFERMMARLEQAQRDWTDLRSGIYCYAESVAYAAARRGDRSMLPLLRRVLALPEMQSEARDELLRERLHMLRIAVLSAMHELGDEAGTQGLRAYQNDERRILREAARMLARPM